jgi:acylphosphatase
MKEQRTVWYSGWVQGVGFRYTTVAVARRYEVTGYVQNLPDGRVVIVAEGESEELDRFLADLEDRMESYIRDKEVQREAASGKFATFGIKY